MKRLGRPFGKREVPPSEQALRALGIEVPTSLQSKQNSQAEEQAFDDLEEEQRVLKAKYDGMVESGMEISRAMMDYFAKENLKKKEGKELGRLSREFEQSLLERAALLAELELLPNINDRLPDNIPKHKFGEYKHLVKDLAESAGYVLHVFDTRPFGYPTMRLYQEPYSFDVVFQRTMPNPKRKRGLRRIFALKVGGVNIRQVQRASGVEKRPHFSKEHFVEFQESSSPNQTWFETLTNNKEALEAMDRFVAVFGGRLKGE